VKLQDKVAIVTGRGRRIVATECNAENTDD